MKKMISLLLVLSMLFALGSNVMADGQNLNSDEQIVLSQMGLAETRGAESAIKDEHILYNFNDQAVATMYIFEPQGYAIYDPVEKIVLEYSLDQNHPFYVDFSTQYYYAGVMNYFVKEDDKFRNLATNGTVMDSETPIITSANFYNDLSEARSLTKADDPGNSLDYGTQFYNCNVTKNYPYFYEYYDEEKLNEVGGVCGSVALAILAAYYDMNLSELAGNGDFADNAKRMSGSRSDNTYGIDLVKEIVMFVEPDGEGTVMLYDFADYLSYHNIDGGMLLGVLSIYSQTRESIDDGKPLLVGFSQYPGETFAHYTVGVSYKTSGGTKQIHVNTGWGWNEWVNASAAVSTWTMYTGN